MQPHALPGGPNAALLIQAHVQTGLTAATLAIMVKFIVMAHTAASARRFVIPATIGLIAARSLTRKAIARTWSLEDVLGHAVPMGVVIPSFAQLVLPLHPPLPLHPRLHLHLFLLLVVVPSQLILTLRQVVPEDYVVPCVEMVSVTGITVRMPGIVPEIAAVEEVVVEVVVEALRLHLPATQDLVKTSAGEDARLQVPGQATTASTIVFRPVTRLVTLARHPRLPANQYPVQAVLVSSPAGRQEPPTPMSALPVMSSVPAATTGLPASAVDVALGQSI